MCEFNPLDSGSESGSVIIMHQLLEENNFIPEEINPNQYQVISSSGKETNDQISITPQKMVGNKRQTSDNSEQIKEDGEKEIKQFLYEEENKENDDNNNKTKKKKKKEKKSRKYEKDLILMKIQCHYISFIIKFINEILSFFNYDKKDRFKDIEHSIKIDVKRENFNQLKSKKLYQIITEKVSIKNRKNNYDEYFNLNLYKKLQKDEIIKNILNENYLNLFRKIYYKGERNLNLKEYGKNIIISLSDNIEMYKDIKKPDEEYINSLNKYVKKMYFSTNKFVIEKKDK